MGLFFGADFTMNTSASLCNIWQLSLWDIFFFVICTYSKFTRLKSLIAIYVLPNFQRLTPMNMWLIDAKVMDVAQPIWLSSCLKKGHIRAKIAFSSFLKPIYFKKQSSSFLLRDHPYITSAYFWTIYPLFIPWHPAGVGESADRSKWLKKCRRILWMVPKVLP